MVEIPPGMLAAKSNAEDDLLDRPGVVGVGVGLAEAAGGPTDVVAIKVYVEPGHPVRASLPATIEGHPVNVVEQPRIELLGLAPGSGPRADSDPDTNKYNPLCGGISAGPTRPFGFNNVFGTLGAVAIDNASGKPMLLSNWHVFAVNDGWSSGDHITQPAVNDGPISVVGGLARAVLTDEVDAAVAGQNSRDFMWSIQDLGEINGTAPATLAMAVEKRGRTTGLTSGTVISLNYTFDVVLPISGKKQRFRDQILINTGGTVFADHGDSGSVVVDSARRVVGLLFAASNDRTWGVANDIAKVTKALNVTIPRSDERPWIDKQVVLDNEHTNGGAILVNWQDSGLVLAWAGYSDKKINIAYSRDAFASYDKTTLEQKVYGEPALAVCPPYGDVGAYMAWTGTNTAGNLNVAGLRSIRSEWSLVSHTILGETSDASPGLARLKDGTLVLVWRGKGNRSINIATSTDGGRTFPNKVVTNQLSPEGPGIANIDGRLYLLWQGTDNVPNIAEITQLKPISLGKHTILNGQRCYGHPNMELAGERLLAWRGTDGDGTINTLQAGTDGVFKNQVVFPESTVAPPTLCRSNESFYMAWTGTNRDRSPNIARLLFGPRKITEETSPAKRRDAVNT